MPARYLRKGSATLLSVSVHLLLIWLLVNKLTAEVHPSDSAGGPGSGLTIIDLSAASASSAASLADTQPTLPAMHPDPLVDTTVATELPAPEWSVVRVVAPPRLQPMRIAAAAAQNAVGATAGHGSASNGAGAAGSGDAAYDPFAGAAPLRRPPTEALSSTRVLLTEKLFGAGSSAAATGELILDRDALERIARGVGARVEGARGTAELIVRVSPQGIVLAVKPGGGSASVRAKLALTKALVGQALFRPSGPLARPQTLRLPVISVG